MTDLKGDDYERAFYRDWEAGKVKRGDGKIMVPEREWVGLTEQEQSDIAWEKDKSRIWIVTATEAKLKEKNT
jgi:hypothetical protein